MEAVAKKNNFSHIMEETWFCHTPYNGKPCGICNPCKYTKEEGLGRRVPKPSMANKSKVFFKKAKVKIGLILNNKKQ